MASTTKSGKINYPVADKIATMINEYDGDNFDAFLKAYDWHSVTSYEIVPCKYVREIIKGIKDKEKSIQTAKFLCKYGDYYFKNGIDSVWRKFRERFVSFQHFAYAFYDAEDPLAAFHSELVVLIDQLESEGEFSVKKMDKIKAENLELKKQIDAIAEIFNLKTREDWANFDMAINGWQDNSLKVERLESENAELERKIKELKKQVIRQESAPITIEQICKYAKKLEKSQRTTISHMLLKLIKNPSDEIRALIDELDELNEMDAKKIIMGDEVQTKIVKP